MLTARPSSLPSASSNMAFDHHHLLCGIMDSTLNKDTAGAKRNWVQQYITPSSGTLCRSFALQPPRGISQPVLGLPTPIHIDTHPTSLPTWDEMYWQGRKRKVLQRARKPCRAPEIAFETPEAVRAWALSCLNRDIETPQTVRLHMNWPMGKEEAVDWVALLAPSELRGESELHRLFPNLETLVVEYHVPKPLIFTDDDLIADISGFDPLLILGHCRRLKHCTILGIKDERVTEYLEDFIAREFAPPRLRRRATNGPHSADEKVGRDGRTAKDRLVTFSEEVHPDDLYNDVKGRKLRLRKNFPVARHQAVTSSNYLARRYPEVGAYLQFLDLEENRVDEFE